MMNNEMNEEYKLQEDDGVNSEEYFEDQVEPSLQDTLPKPVKASKFKKLLIPLGIIIAIFIVYNILNWFSAKKSEADVKQESEVAQKQQEAFQKEAAQQAAAQAAAAASQQIQQPVVQPTSINSEQLNEMNKRNEAINEQLTNLNQKLAANQSEILNLSGKMDQLAGAVITIQDELQKAKEEAIQQKKIKAAKPKTVKLPIYHIRAIVPNRAWLESSEGDTVTVRVGNKLEGYGIVELISPKQGMVVTSSGTVIQYGVNDF